MEMHRIQIDDVMFEFTSLTELREQAEKHERVISATMVAGTVILELATGQEIAITW